MKFLPDIVEMMKTVETRFSQSSSLSSWSSLNSFHAVVSAFNLFANSAKEAIFLNLCSRPSIRV
uniref:Neurofibromin n=1 Tax=Romanomermis culicivorax TaxID=13658 RepID=A0A915JIC6_ROMCU